mmetsp:Transcript_11468/g.20744  ORF Transcript_11468/g.20744 Transcript_11468/m.20744 type:complete len:174 (+) Transcript_11468:99-620(+)
MDFDDLSSLDYDYGRKASFGRRLIYFLVALIPSLLILALFMQVRGLPVEKYPIILAPAIVAAMVFLSLAYHNLAFVRSAQIHKKYSAPTKSMFRNKPDEWNAACFQFEATIKSSSVMYSIAYNNAIYLFAAVALALNIGRISIPEPINFAISCVGGAAAAYGNSLSARKLSYA